MVPTPSGSLHTSASESGGRAFSIGDIEPDEGRRSGPTAGERPVAMVRAEPGLHPFGWVFDG
jgi:hypothetical protein